MMFGPARLSAVAATVIGIAPDIASAYSADKDVVDTAVAAGHFETLAAALTAAGLVDTLKGPSPFTVFAPTDAAFAKLPAGTVDSLLINDAKVASADIVASNGVIHVIENDLPQSA